MGPVDEAVEVLRGWNVDEGGLIWGEWSAMDHTLSIGRKPIAIPCYDLPGPAFATQVCSSSARTQMTTGAASQPIGSLVDVSYNSWTSRNGWEPKGPGKHRWQI